MNINKDRMLYHNYAAPTSEVMKFENHKVIYSNLVLNTGVTGIINDFVK